jgi:uncharacterized protein
MMSGLFTIPVGGIKAGHHVYEFKIDKEFFDLFEESEIKEGKLVAVAEVDKSPSHFDLNIRISGEVEVSCDRCLRMFSHPVKCENKLLVKFGQEKNDENPEIITIPRDANELDLKQYLYEFIYLALPIRRMHPDNADGTSKCDPQMLQKLKEHLVEKEKNNDPRWNELKKLMNDN